MTVSYTPGGTTSIDRVRFAVSATALNSPLQDEEITELVSSQGSWQGAAAAIFWRRHADLAAKATDHSNTEGSVSYGSQLSALQAQAERWDREAAAAASTPSDLPRALVRNFGPYAGSPGWRQR